jgi:hypothetical protein
MPMRSLTQLADNYERWAAENDAIVAAITHSVECVPQSLRDHQLRQISAFTEEAEILRNHAARLRKTKLRPFEPV